MAQVTGYGTDYGGIHYYGVRALQHIRRDEITRSITQQHSTPATQPSSLLHTVTSSSADSVLACDSIRLATWRFSYAFLHYHTNNSPPLEQAMAWIITSRLFTLRYCYS